MADVVIRNGKIIDGAGNPWYHGDVAVSGGVITAVGEVRESAAATRSPRASTTETATMRLRLRALSKAASRMFIPPCRVMAGMVSLP